MCAAKCDFNVITNTVESFLLMLKSSNYGIHHHVSRKYFGVLLRGAGLHLQREQAVR